MIEFTISGKPYGKGRPRFTRNGHVYTPQKTAEYEELVRLFYRQTAHGTTLNAPIEATIFAQFAPPKSDSKAVRAQKLSGEILPTIKPDCDNIAKTILDALNGIAYKDDSQITELHVYKLYGAEAKVTVRLREISLWEKVTNWITGKMQKSTPTRPPTA